MTIHDVGVKRIDHTSTQSSIVKMESMKVVEELLEMLKDVGDQMREGRGSVDEGWWYDSLLSFTGGADETDKTAVVDF